MTKIRRRAVAEYPDDATDLIVVHPSGHVDIIELDQDDNDIDEADAENEDQG